MEGAIAELRPKLLRLRADCVARVASASFPFHPLPSIFKCCSCPQLNQFHTNRSQPAIRKALGEREG